MAVSHLQCKECQAEYPLEALYVCDQCFGPLEVIYDHSAATGDVGELRRRIQGGPENVWRCADFLPLAGGPPGPSGRLASRVGLPAGCTPLIRADRLAERLGLREVWVKNDAATCRPTRSCRPPATPTGCPWPAWSRSRSSSCWVRRPSPRPCHSP